MNGRTDVERGPVHWGQQVSVPRSAGTCVDTSTRSDDALGVTVFRYRLGHIRLGGGEWETAHLIEIDPQWGYRISLGTKNTRPVDT